MRRFFCFIGILAMGSVCLAQKRTEDAPFRTAIEDANWDRFIDLLEHGHGVNEVDMYGMTPIFHCAAWGRPKFAKELIARKADLEFQLASHTTMKADGQIYPGQRIEMYGMRPIHFAAFWGTFDTMKLIVEAGVPVDRLSGTGMQPLHYAASSLRARDAMHQGEIITYLIDQGAQADARNTDGWTPMHLAASKDLRIALKVLIEKHASLELKTPNGNTLCTSRHSMDLIALARCCWRPARGRMSRIRPARRPPTWRMKKGLKR